MPKDIADAVHFFQMLAANIPDISMRVLLKTTPSGPPLPTKRSLWPEYTTTLFKWLVRYHWLALNVRPTFQKWDGLRHTFYPRY